MSGSVFEGSFIARRSGTAAQTHRMFLTIDWVWTRSVLKVWLFNLTLYFSKMWRLLSRRTDSLGRNTVICRWSLSCREQTADPQTFFPLVGLFYFRQRDVWRLRERELCVPRPAGSGWKMGGERNQLWAKQPAQKNSEYPLQTVFIKSSLLTLLTLKLSSDQDQFTLNSLFW